MFSTVLLKAVQWHNAVPKQLWMPRVYTLRTSMMVLMLKIWFLAPLCLTRNLYSTSCISLRLYFSTSCKSFFNAKFFTHALANRSLDRSKSRLVHTHKQVNKHPQHREHHIHDSVHASLTIQLGSEPSPPPPPVSHLLAWSHCGYKSHASTNKLPVDQPHTCDCSTYTHD